MAFSPYIVARLCRGGPRRLPSARYMDLHPFLAFLGNVPCSTNQLDLPYTYNCCVTMPMPLGPVTRARIVSQAVAEAVVEHPPVRP